MGPATLISLLILVVVASVVLKDLSRMQAAARPAPRPEDSPLIPRNVNDPMALDLQSRAQQFSAGVGGIVGAAAAGGAGRAAGSAVAASQVELARGLGSQSVSVAEQLELGQKAHAAGNTGSQTVGLDLVGSVGGLLGSLLALPLTIAGSAGSSAGIAANRAAEQLARSTPSGDIYDVPLAGAIYRVQDWKF